MSSTERYPLPFLLRHIIQTDRAAASDGLLLLMMVRQCLDGLLPSSSLYTSRNAKAIDKVPTRRSVVHTRIVALPPLIR